MVDPEKRKQHDPAHPFFPITSSFDLPMHNEIRKEIAGKSQEHLKDEMVAQVTHTDVYCDGCIQTEGPIPFIGVRHKCLDCAGMVPLDRCDHELGALTRNA